MEISTATLNDIDEIIPLQSQIYRVDSSPENVKQTIEELINSNYCDIFVARKNGNVAGSGLIFYLKNPGHKTPFAYLEGIVVDDKQRGEGLGTALAKFAIELARKKNCYKVIFTSGLDRQDVHKFYKNLGFKKWGLEFRMDL